MSQTIDVSAIPHRPPFLFVDDVVEVSESSIVTTWRAKEDSAFFQGHYPSQPVMPGVLICECCFQAGALLIAHRIGAFGAENVIPVLTRIRGARFRRIVRPGETLRVEVQLEDELDDAFYMSGAVTVDGEKCLSVRFVCMGTAGGGADS